MMKTILIFSLILFSFSANANAKKYKLDFEPNGKVVKFKFDSMVIYTDTTSLMSLYNEKEDYDLRVINYIRKSIRDINNDTITFNGENIPFDDGIINKYQEDWYIKWAILELVKKRKVHLIDKYGNKVKIIVTKRIGKKKQNYVKRSDINEETGAELFKETLFVRLVNPSF